MLRRSSGINSVVVKPIPPVRVPRVRVQIGEARVGPGQRTFIIAEAGVNHDGSLAQALRLVDVACDCGADAVKFQVFRAAELATEDAAAADYQQRGGATSQRALLARLELDDAVFGAIRKHCRHRGIPFLATPFGLRDVDRLIALEVPAIKIASTDLTNLPLLDRAIAANLPLIVSTGAATAEEIRGTVDFLRRRKAGDRLVLLHCVSSYPTPLGYANLRAITTLADTFGVPVGYSDHTSSNQTGAWAVAAGASVLEKHFTLDPRAAGPDHAISLDPDGLRAYITGVRDAETALGSGRLGHSQIEEEVRRLARKSVVAAVALPVSTILTPDLLTLKRPSGGIAPADLESLFGRRLKRPVAADAPLHWDDLE